jgi:hypothetical protein
MYSYEVSSVLFYFLLFRTFAVNHCLGANFKKGFHVGICNIGKQGLVAEFDVFVVGAYQYIVAVLRLIQHHVFPVVFESKEDVSKQTVFTTDQVHYQHTLRKEIETSIVNHHLSCCASVVPRESPPIREVETLIHTNHYR